MPDPVDVMLYRTISSEGYLAHLTRRVQIDTRLLPLLTATKIVELVETHGEDDTSNDSIESIRVIRDEHTNVFGRVEIAVDDDITGESPFQEVLAYYTKLGWQVSGTISEPTSPVPLRRLGD